FKSRDIKRSSQHFYVHFFCFNDKGNISLFFDPEESLSAQFHNSFLFIKVLVQSKRGFGIQCYTRAVRQNNALHFSKSGHILRTALYRKCPICRQCSQKENTDRNSSYQPPSL